MKNLTKKTLAITLLISLATGTTLSAKAEDAMLVDKTYVTISGELKDFVDKDSFRMSYWGGDMLVDVNDGRPDLFKNNMKDNLNIGDKVVVSGIVDDHTFSEKEIDASNISVIKSDLVTTYDGNINTSKMHKMDLSEFYSNYNLSAMNNNHARISGYITEVPNTHQFVLNYGPSKLLVELNDMELNKPTTFRIGDFVVIEGIFNKDLFNSTVIEADNITKVSYYQVIKG
jgi:uncharacterized protein YdeI (BOF family)